MANSFLIQATRPRLLGVIAQGKALSGLPHPGVKGRLREILVRDILTPFLPPQVSIVTGTIVAPGVDQRLHRNQDDLVLFSRSLAPLLLNDSECIIPLEGVLGEIEVNTRLERADVIKAVRAATELRDLASRDRESPLGILFSYESDLTAGSEAGRLLEVLKEVSYVGAPGQATSPIQAICIVDRGIWTLTCKDGREGWWFVSPDDGNHLLTFLSIISNTLYQRFGAKGGVGDYLLELAWLQGPDPQCSRLVPR